MKPRTTLIMLLIGPLVVSGVALAAEPVNITVATGAVGQN